MGSCHAAPCRHPDRHRHHRHGRLQRRRRCAGWRLRDRRARPDDLGRRRGGDYGVATSAPVALFVSITVVFVYTSVTNIIERPEGIKIASVFILSIVITSLVSRTLRSTELRVLGIVPDPLAEQFIDEAARGGEINIIANRPGAGDRKEYEDKLREARQTHHLTPDDPGAVSRSRAGRRVGVQRSAPGAGALAWTAIACCGARAPRSPMRLRRSCFTSAIGPPRFPRVFRMDGRQPCCLPAEVPGVWRRGHRPGDA